MLVSSRARIDSSEPAQVIALARSEDKLARLLEIAKGLNPDCALFPVAFDIVHDDYADLKQVHRRTL